MEEVTLIAGVILIYLATSGRLIAMIDAIRGKRP